MNSRRVPVLAPLTVTLGVTLLALAALNGGPALAGGDLGGNHRFLGHVSTDKPLYKPGETLYARIAVLHAFARTPIASQAGVQVQVKSPKGEVVNEGWTFTQEGVAAFHWEIPEDIAGGTFRLVAKFPQNGFPEAEHELEIRAYRAPRLNTEIEFVRDGYGPGDEVTAAFNAVRAEGGAPAGAPVTAIATVDGVECHRGKLTLDSDGNATVKFRLPAKIEDGRGTLALVVDDGGVRETATKTIPIVVASVSLWLYPEGGELVAGLPTRVYMEARNRYDRPADIAGRVVDADGNEVAKFRTEHEGRGRVAFTPKAGATYRVAIDEPAGVSKRYDLPAVAAKGYTIGAVDDVVAAGDPVRLNVGATEAGKAKVVLSVREREVSSLPVELAAGETKQITLTPPGTADAVLRATVLDPDGTPRAERLIFRRPEREVKVALELSQERTTPRGSVELKVVTTDARGKPVSAVVGLRVVDDSVLEKIEKRDRAPRLPVQAMLGSEVRELKDAHVYLSDDAEAPVALDLLLGTQGWRRFAFERVDEFIAEQGQAGRRALAKCDPPPPPRPARPRMRGADLGGGGAPGGMDGAEAEGMAMPPAPGAPMPEDDARGAPEEKAKGEAAPDRALGEQQQGQQPQKRPEPAPDPAAGEKQDQADRPAPAPRPKVAPEAGARRAERERFEMDEEAPAAEPEPMPFAGRARQQRIAYRRVYAHEAMKGGAGQRLDFAETLYWNAGLSTDANGEATVRFDAADSITTFRVQADAFAADGALGAADATVEVRKPFYIEPKLPLEVTAGDRIGLPIALANGSAEDLDVTFAIETGDALKITGEVPAKVRIAADERGLVSVPITVGAAFDDMAVRITGRSGPFADDVIRSVRVVPRGFPIELATGGQLEPGKDLVWEVTIPEKVDPTSIVTEALVYPSPLAQLTQALQALLREPYGCFEQTSSTAYPNVMAMQYFVSHQGVDPTIVKRASDLLDKGYKRLVSFECKEKGYEWFGGDPGHEALTAYGLMEFSEMAGVGYGVDPEMLERTKRWLLSRRDGKGGFERNPRALDSFGGAPADITNAYIVWALTETGVDGKELEKEIASLREQALASKDAYFLALVTNILLNVGDDAASKVAARLAEQQAEDGSLTGAKTSITRSGGEGLLIETTSLAILAWLRTPEQTARCEHARRWLLERCKAGRFGSTQSTVLALKAINAYDAARAVPKQAGAVLVEIDGKVFDEAPFTKDQEGEIRVPSFAEKLTPGKHVIKIRMVGGSPMPCSVAVGFHTDKPASAEQCGVSIETALGKAEVTEGETVELTATVKNRDAAEGAPMTVAIIGLPGGLEPRADQLKELVDGGMIGAFELRRREVILYWRALAPGAQKVVHMDLVAAVPGSYEGPASRAYLYYTDEHKHWVDGLKVRIAPR